VRSSHFPRRAVERGLPDTVAFLQELVRVPSLLGNEEPAQQLVEERLRELGFDVRSVEPSGERLASHPDSGIPLVPYELNGHVDVVSEAPAGRWTRPPFGAEIDGGRLYGRGASDMKGGIAAMLLAVEAALAAGPLPGPVVYQSVIEEECGGTALSPPVSRALQRTAS
jgi:acetylornithine deacetylase